MCKGIAILYIYDKLLQGEEVYMETIINDLNISVRTFRRYISDIKTFLYDNFKNQTIAYSKIKNSYSLRNL